MNWSILKLPVFLLMLVIAPLGVQAQSCYKMIRAEGITFYKAGKYRNALAKFELAADCHDLPSRHDLRAWKDSCNTGIDNLIIELENTVQNLNNATADNYLINAERLVREKDFNAAKLYSLYALNIDPISSDKKERAKTIINENHDFRVYTLRLGDSREIWDFDITEGKPIIALAYNDYNSIKVWNYNTGTELNSIPAFWANSVVFNPSGTQLAIGSRLNGLILLWDLEKNKEIALFNKHKKKITDLAFSPDGRFLASTSDDNTAMLWDLNYLQRIDSIGDLDGPKNKVLFSPNGTHLAIGYKDKKVKLYDLSTRTVLNQLNKHENEIVDFRFTPDSQYLITGSRDGVVKYGELYTARDSIHLDANSNNTSSMALRFDGNIIALSKGNRIQIWLGSQNKDWSLITSLNGHRESVYKLKYFPQDDYLFSVGDDERTIKVWEIKDEKIQVDSTTITKIDSLIFVAEDRFNQKKEGTVLTQIDTPIDSLFNYTDRLSEDTAILAKFLEYHESSIYLEEDLLYNVALIYAKQKKFEKAAEFIDLFIGQAPSEAVGWKQKGMIAFQDRKYDTAQECFEKMVKISPYDTQLWNDLVLFYLNRTDYEKGKACIDKIIEINPYHDDAYLDNQLAHYYNNNKDVEKAITFFEKSVEKVPQYINSLINLGMIYAEKNEYQKAMDYANHAIDASPSDEYDWVLIGEICRLVYMRNRDTSIMQTGMSYYQRAFEINNRSPIALIGLGIGHYELNECEAALEYLSQAYSIDPDDFDAALNLAELYIDHKKWYDQAEPLIKRVLENAPNNASANALYARIFQERGKLEKAKTYFDKASKYMDIPYLDKHIAYYHLQKKELKKAKEYLDKVTLQVPDDKWVLRNWACYYALKKEQKTALEYLQNAFNMGYADTEWLVNDPILDNLRKDKGYRKLLDELNVSPPNPEN